MTISGNDDAGHGFPRAVYSKQAIRQYAGNCFIEALPPLTDEEGLVAGMWRRAEVTAEDRAQSALHRLHMLEMIPNSFMQPLTEHVLMATQVSAMIRAGYVTRDPSSPTFLRSLGLAVAALNNPIPEPSDVSGHGMAIIGMSGIGKSTAIDAVLRTYPRVIWHSDLTGPLRTTLQVTYLKVSCPIDGSLKTLLRDSFTELDRLLGTTYHALNTPRGTVDSMRDALARLAFIHGLGVLVIDELQNLARAQGVNQKTLLNFFLVLRDVLKVPVIAIGTEEALPVLAATMKEGRRHSGQPLFERMRDDAEFEMFCDALFGAYYLREPLDPSPAFRKALYDLSQGIADIVIKLFSMAQARALVDGRESIDSASLCIAYDQGLHLLHHHLDDIRSGRQLDGATYEEATRQMRGNSSGAGPVAPARATVRAADIPSSERRSVARARREPAEVGRAAVGDQSPTAAGGVVPGRLLAALDGRAAGTSAHAALKAAGFIRDLGAEVIAGR